MTGEQTTMRSPVSGLPRYDLAAGGIGYGGIGVPCTCDAGHAILSTAYLERHQAGLQAVAKAVLRFKGRHPDSEAVVYRAPARVALEASQTPPAAQGAGDTVGEHPGAASTVDGGGGEF